MSGDPSSTQPSDRAPQRRGSVALSTLFQRGASAGPIASAAALSDQQQAQRRRMSLSTTLGLSPAGTSPTATAAFGSAAVLRRASLSTNASSGSGDAFDDNAVAEEDDVAARAAPNGPFARRTSFGSAAAAAAAASSLRGGFRGPGSPGANADQGYNWSEQLRSRAESFSSSGRPVGVFGGALSGSPPRAGGASASASGSRDRHRSAPDLPAPPAQAAAMSPRPVPSAAESRKPDPFQERILKGDFYMD